jgi:hypothetical protein
VRWQCAEGPLSLLTSLVLTFAPSPSFRLPAGAGPHNVVSRSVDKIGRQMEGEREERRDQQLLYVPRCNLVHGVEVAPTRRVVRVLLAWCMMQRRRALGRPAVVAMGAHTTPLPLSNKFSFFFLSSFSARVLSNGRAGSCGRAEGGEGWEAREWKRGRVRRLGREGRGGCWV